MYSNSFIVKVGWAKALVLFMGVRIVNFTPVAFRSHTYTGLFDQSWNWYFKFDFDLGIRHIFLYIEYTMPRYLYDIKMLISKLIKKKVQRWTLNICLIFYVLLIYICCIMLRFRYCIYCNKALVYCFQYILKCFIWQVKNPTARIEHEASTSKIGEDQLFYFQQRGIEYEKAMAAMISGFCRDVFNELPDEFGSEVNQLMSLKLEGSVG